tara:strand:+ start:2745 stop:3749 length:1005 start_codon:yes stop_codon:yes gene_type:complete
MNEQNGLVPLIDISPFLSGDIYDKQRLAKAVDDACKNIGFLIITGHSVPESLITEMYKTSAEYFSLPLWEKMALKMPPDRYRGYTPMGSESLASSLDNDTPSDLKESFSIGPFDVPYDEYHFGSEGARYFAPNYWPDKPNRMRSIWESYFSEMNRLANDLMRIFAVALDVSEDFFENKIDKHITNFSAIHYPGQKHKPKENQLRGGQHTDYGSLTIVNTNSDVGGLEVERRDGSWEPVPWVKDAFSINIGDLMAEWTNDRWVSTMHRVANPPSTKSHMSKTSLLFFHQPNYDAEIECIPTCTSSDNLPKYSKTTSGKHVTMKITKHRSPGLEKK